jgi:hypothetical protein
MALEDNSDIPLPSAVPKLAMTREGKVSRWTPRLTMTYADRLEILSPSCDMGCRLVDTILGKKIERSRGLSSWCGEKEVAHQRRFDMGWVFPKCEYYCVTLQVPWKLPFSVGVSKFKNSLFWCFNVEFCLGRCYGAWTVTCTFKYCPWTGSIKPSLQHFQFCHVGFFFKDSYVLYSNGHYVSLDTDINNPLITPVNMLRLGI